MLLSLGLTMPNIVVYYRPFWNGIQMSERFAKRSEG